MAIAEKKKNNKMKKIQKVNEFQKQQNKTKKNLLII